MTRGDQDHAMMRRDQMLRWLRKHPGLATGEIRRRNLYLYPGERTLRTDLELLESRGIVRQEGAPARWTVIA